MMKLLRRICLLWLALMLAISPALGEGVRFTLRATLDPAAFPADLQPLFSGIQQLLEVASIDGTLVTDGGSFELNAALHLGSGRTKSDTTLRLYGLESHWGLRSSLLGDTELMINVASLLPFGQKARSFLGIPLDMAALLVPYTHVDALSAVMTVTAPLFPRENGRTTLSRAEMDSIVAEVVRLCDEDPALNRYLHATGMYGTVMHYAAAYSTIPTFLLPSLTVRRTDDSLTWSSGFIPILSVRDKDGVITLDFSLPTLAEAEAKLTRTGGTISGSCRIDISSLQVTGSFSFPTDGSVQPAPITLTLDASSPVLPEGGVHLRVEGERNGESITLRLLHPDSQAMLLQITGDVAAFDAPELPDWRPEDLTGMDVLSVNSDSLRRLMAQVRWPLMDGVFEIVVAAPAPAVQTIMDWAEDSGMIDMLADMLSGGSGY